MSPVNRKILTSLIAVGLTFSGMTAWAQTILLVPQDNRPVSLDYTVSTAEKAGYTVITPPRSYLSGSNYRGYPDRIWRWVEDNISRADVCVLSTDTLIYGGLVDSRKHNESLDELAARENRIRSLHQNYPRIPIYAFGTIMRTPYNSNSGVEPSYYSNYGNTIYQISALQDKMDRGTITTAETQKLLALKLSVPAEYLQDWYKRRSKNTYINQRLIKDVKNGTFTYFCLGHDDSSANSQSAMESRYLTQDADGINSKKYGSFPGADQLALLLIARYHVDSNHMKPKFSVIYPLGRAEDTVPSYESQPIGKTISEHIEAVGGEIVKDNKIPDLVLAVNTPLASTGESSQFENFGMLKQSTKDFVSEIKEVVDRGIPVSVADVYFANGSDNTLMNLLSTNDLLYRISAYDGWNTASNTVGYAIAQAILAPSMSEQDRKDMLTEQYIDNWAYQANVRKNLYRIAPSYPGTNGRNISSTVQTELVAELQDFAEKKMNINPQTISASFPWDRFFEIKAEVSSTPKYPREITLAEKQRRAEEAARKAAEEAKKKAEEAAKKNQTAAAQPAAGTSYAGHVSVDV
jgi:hypothetical protein